MRNISTKYRKLLLLFGMITTFLLGTVDQLTARGTSYTSLPVFTFFDYINVKESSVFDIVIKRETGLIKIGTGKVIILQPERLHFEFNLNEKGISISGKMALQYKKTTPKNIVLDLVYSGKYNRRNESSQEVVLADRFLAENNILSFRYQSKKRFMQLSLNSRKETAFVSEYGTARILPTGILQKSRKSKKRTRVNKN